MHDNTLLKYNIQFITHQTNTYNHYQSALMALEGGVAWIQLRMKDCSMEFVKQQAQWIQDACKKHNALFFIDDYVELAAELQADGVHLGQKDMPITQARQIVGNQLYIGGTANTFEQIKQLHEDGVDYVGLGPFAYTETKKNLSPILGVEGVKKIIGQCRKNNIHLPIHIIGGIKKEDAPSILQAGANAVAVSSAILNSENPIQEAVDFVSSLNQ